jgi:hypothetical protein
LLKSGSKAVRHFETVGRQGCRFVMLPGSRYFGPRCIQQHVQGLFLPCLADRDCKTYLASVPLPLQRSSHELHAPLRLMRATLPSLLLTELCIRIHSTSCVISPPTFRGQQIRHTKLILFPHSIVTSLELARNGVV